MKIFLTIFCLFSSVIFAQFGTQDSGGLILPEQAAYDVKFYELDLNIDPDKKSISGSALIVAELLSSIDYYVLHLDTVFIIKRILINNEAISFEHKNGLIKIEVEEDKFEIGDIIEAKIFYSGKPRIAQRPPWDDGFVWKKTKDSSHWIGLTCQGGGADIWFPCKDHPSDEPDSVSIKITAPDNLTCASNGKLIGEAANNDGTKTTHWFVSTPINNYNINITLAPFKLIEHTFTSITGEDFPVMFYVLPESYDTAKVFTNQFLDHLRFYEKYCGPYPFRADKYGIVETPYLGMEHQTIIAYGNGYKNNQFGFDWLHHHELAHEWWGNLITASDWRDFWIHEGIGTYMQALYAEELSGSEGLQKFMKTLGMMNVKPVLQEESIPASKAYHPDIYNKGAWFVHTLRYYLGDEIFYKVLRRWAYPTEELEQVKDGSQCRFVTTEDLIEQIESISGEEVSWLFDVYLRNAKLPELAAVLIEKDYENELRLQWISPDETIFEMPVEIKLGNEIQMLEMTNGRGKIKFSSVINPIIDPNNWIAKKEIKIEKYSKKGF
ncbi:MAG: M1 family metallopeptidase [Melioribacteraceae bacterium]|jgi:aminopeptidase N|nr:M1 family metallopeptidase [Melioribacteraceae bacterium]